MGHRVKIMVLLYDLIFLIFALIYLPAYLFKRKFHQGFLARLGALPQGLNLNRPIWIHAVSLGEVMAIRGLLEELRRVYPEKNFVISTVTETGNKIAKNLIRETDFVTYLPLDLSFIIRKVINRVNPSLFILAETEIWPNLISCLSKKNIPIIIVNARISDRSFKGYSLIRFLLKPQLNKILLFCAQTQLDAERFTALGVSQEKIKVSGNLKFDTMDYTDKRTTEDTDYKQKIGLKSDEKLLVAASTHPGEEKIILGVYKELLSEFSSLRLLIAPRHPERTKDVERVIRKYKFNSLRVSGLADVQVNPLTRKPANPLTIFILDTVGELMNYYAIANIVFVGGSLVQKGGHNILEPAALEKPILFGPHIFNFRDIMDLFLANQAAIMVNSPYALKQKIKEFLINPGQALELGRKAKEVLLKNTGSTKRTIELIRKIGSF